MKSRLFVGLIVLSIASMSAAADQPGAALGSFPPYQMRARLPDGDRLAPAADGETAFSHHCGYCHLAGGMGTNVLTPQQLAIGNSADMALLANRTDLTADYVRAVVRNGKGAMPMQTRVDITDAELEIVARWLADHEGRK